jgi:UDP-4-amino-4,6-dideoxy-N-acetyl-beta-L-altrosamine N-acetyltransferase
MSISFKEVAVDDAEMILRWRTSEHITKYMNTDLPWDLESQKNWISSCRSKEDYYHWIVTYENDPIGLININTYSRRDKTTYWGFYIGSEKLKGIGAFVPPLFYNWAFGKLEVKGIFAEVFYNNLRTIELHRLNRYKFMPDMDKVITKNGREILIVSMSLSASDWCNARNENRVPEFPTSLWNFAPHFKGTPESSAGARNDT